MVVPPGSPVLASTLAVQPAAPASAKIARRQSHTRERILGESARLFLARGFETVSVDSIVVASGIARSSFYRFFSNREEVLASIIRPVFESGVAMMRDIGRQPPGTLMDGVFGVYLRLWAAGPASLRLATRMGGGYFRLFEDVHQAFRQSLTTLVCRVEPTGLLLNGSGVNSARLIARTAVPVLEVYGDDPQRDTLFRQTMGGMLMKPESTS